MKKIEDPYFRLNTRVKIEHRDFIKSFSKKRGITEGQVMRDALDLFIGINKK